MRLDHIAYRVKNRVDAARFLEKTFGYCIADEFDIEHDSGEKAICYALRCEELSPDLSKSLLIPQRTHEKLNLGKMKCNRFDAPPEIFISQGSPLSVVGRWVDKNGPGIHHLAYEVDSVENEMKRWIDNKLGDFTTSDPITNGDLIQCFTKPHPLMGVVFEFIKRGKADKGFNPHNVKRLMESTDDR